MFLSFTEGVGEVPNKPLNRVGWLKKNLFFCPKDLADKKTKEAEEAKIIVFKNEACAKTALMQHTMF